MKVRVTMKKKGYVIQGFANTKGSGKPLATKTVNDRFPMDDIDQYKADIMEVTDLAKENYAKLHAPHGYTIIREAK